jgi:hypothetical protein
MPTHGSRDCRYGKLGDSRRRADSHIAPHVGKGGATSPKLQARFADAHPDNPTVPDPAPYRSSNRPIVGEPRSPVTNDRR